jgi:hypothetical protein
MSTIAAAQQTALDSPEAPGSGGSAARSVADPEHDSPAPPWMGRCLRLAAIYNLAWGGFAIAAPGAIFAWLGMDPPRYPMFWQCIGMIVGVYGVGYWIAASDPLRHWPIVLVGWLGKILGPIGFAGALWRGDLPIAFGVNIIFNDLIWWIPFTLILAAVLRRAVAGDPYSEPAPPFSRELAGRFVDQHRRSLASHLGEGPMLLLLLRHGGCTFCREAIADLEPLRNGLELEGVQLGVVHMAQPEVAPKDAGASAGCSIAPDLTHVPQFADPDRLLYRSVGLGRGSWRELFGPAVAARGLAAFVRGHGVGALAGDGLQMPGAALIRDGELLGVRRHRHAGERPDFVAWVRERLGGGQATQRPGEATA